MRSASPSLLVLAKSHESIRRLAPRSLGGLPKSTPQADAFAKQLKSQGYRFVGPTSVYAFMQNVGVVNDHIHGCFRASTTLNTQPQPTAVEAAGALDREKQIAVVCTLSERVRERRKAHAP